MTRGRELTKEIIVIINNEYKMCLEDDWVSFSKNNGLSVFIPIEVFYQMWNGDELVAHMEAYHQKRKTDDV